MKMNIKMRVTPEQSRKVQEICFENGIFWDVMDDKNKIRVYSDYLYISTSITHDSGNNKDYFNRNYSKEIDADLFIRTNGTCEENELKDFIQSQDENIDRVNNWTKEFNDISLKLKKKNEILKKARIKRKNQREELHKLNLKLQKCISLEQHNKIVKTKTGLIDYQSNYINQLNEQLKNYTSIKKSSQIVFDKLNDKIKEKQAVIDYLESKVK